MIDGTHLKFGYGDIAVSTWGLLTLTLTPFKPPVEVGTSCGKLLKRGDIEITGNPIQIRFDNLQDLNDLRKKIEDVYANEMFEFKGYIFDFTNYNAKSIEVIERNLNAIQEQYLRLCAC